MAFLDSIGKKITSTTQNVVRGTKDLTDMARLNSLISGEQQQINNLYAQIGKLYYESEQHDAETALGKLCLAITACTERIAKHNEAILEIKGSRKCPKCGASIPLSSAFCGVCGSQFDPPQTVSDQPSEEKKFCTNCGAAIAAGAAFCTSCGHKVE
jgi:ribosomal protein L40E